jgi:hypothetical protein
MLRRLIKLTPPSLYTVCEKYLFPDNESFCPDHDSRGSLSCQTMPTSRVVQRRTLAGTESAVSDEVGKDVFGRNGRQYLVFG